MAQERQLWGCFCCVNAPRAGPSPARWYCYSYGQFSAFKFCKTILRKISPWRCWLSSRLEIAFPCLKFLTEFQMENVQLHFPSRAAVTHFNNRGCTTPQRWPRASILKRTRWSGCGEGLDGGAGAERAAEEKEPRLQPSSRRVPCGPFCLPSPAQPPREEIGICGLIFSLPVAVVMSSPLRPPPQVMGHPCSGQDQVRLLHCSTRVPG